MEVIPQHWRVLAKHTPWGQPYSLLNTDIPLPVVRFQPACIFIERQMLTFVNGVPRR